MTNLDKSQSLNKTKEKNIDINAFSVTQKFRLRCEVILVNANTNFVYSIVSLKPMNALLIVEKNT